MIRLIYGVMALSVALLLLLINVRLYHPDMDGYGIQEIGPDVLSQLHFIKIKLNEGSAEEMQALFPEGYFFSYAFYGLSWVNIGLREPEGSELRQEALRDARWALEFLDSSTGKKAFSATLTPPYGVFYVGWSTWLRGGILLLQPAEARDPDEIARFQADCMALAEAFESSPTPFLTSHPNRAWPVDSVAGIAALRLHDKLFGPPRNWAESRRDGLLPRLNAGWSKRRHKLIPKQDCLRILLIRKQASQCMGQEARRKVLSLDFCLKLTESGGMTNICSFESSFSSHTLACRACASTPWAWKTQEMSIRGP